MMLCMNQHTFCLECIQDLWKKGYKKCPLDQNTYEIDKIQKNRFILSIVNKIDPKWSYLYLIQKITLGWDGPQSLSNCSVLLTSLGHSSICSALPSAIASAISLTWLILTLNDFCLQWKQNILILLLIISLHLGQVICCEWSSKQDMWKWC